MKISSSLAKKLQQYLQVQFDQNRSLEAQSLLKEFLDSQNGEKLWLNWMILKVASLMGFAYLITSVLGVTSKQIQLEDIILFAIILLFNSGVFEKLQEVEIGKEGISFKVLHDQVQEVESMIVTQKANIEAHSGAIERLAVSPINVEGEFNRSLLSQSELKLLQKLHEAELDNHVCDYFKRYDFEVELRTITHIRICQKPFWDNSC